MPQDIAKPRNPAEDFDIERLLSTLGEPSGFQNVMGTLSSAFAAASSIGTGNPRTAGEIFSQMESDRKLAGLRRRLNALALEDAKEVLLSKRQERLQKERLFEPEFQQAQARGQAAGPLAEADVRQRRAEAAVSEVKATGAGVREQMELGKLKAELDAAQERLRQASALFEPELRTSKAKARMAEAQADIAPERERAEVEKIKGEAVEGGLRSKLMQAQTEQAAARAGAVTRSPEEQSGASMLMQKIAADKALQGAGISDRIADLLSLDTDLDRIAEMEAQGAIDPATAARERESINARMQAIGRSFTAQEADAASRHIQEMAANLTVGTEMQRPVATRPGERKGVSGAAQAVIERLKAARRLSQEAELASSEAARNLGTPLRADDAMALKRLLDMQGLADPGSVAYIRGLIERTVKVPSAQLSSLALTPGLDSFDARSAVYGTSGSGAQLPVSSEAGQFFVDTRERKNEAYFLPGVAPSDTGALASLFGRGLPQDSVTRIIPSFLGGPGLDVKQFPMSAAALQNLQKVFARTDESNAILQRLSTAFFLNQGDPATRDKIAQVLMRYIGPTEAVPGDPASIVEVLRGMRARLGAR